MKRLGKLSIGFTLIELLIVVAIIAVLAAIAVPNFLEAQTRAKVSRAKADMRTVATALEIYRVDHTGYPSMIESGFTGGYPAGTPPLNQSELKWWYIPDALSTPIAYLTTSDLHCPFSGNIDKERYFPGRIWRRYGYENIPELIEKAKTFPILRPRNGPWLLVTTGDWRLQCVGPDKLWNPSVLYDPTNGTVSDGDIIRTQKAPTGNTKPDLPRP